MSNTPETPDAHPDREASSNSPHLLPALLPSLPIFARPEAIILPHSYRRAAAEPHSQKMPSPVDSLEDADLGIERKRAEVEMLDKDIEIALGMLKDGALTPKRAEERLRQSVDQRAEALHDLEEQRTKKQRLEGRDGLIEFIDIRASYISEGIAATVRQFSRGTGRDNVEGVPKVNAKKRAENWRRDVTQWYGAQRDDGTTWCHISAKWHPPSEVKAAHIVPHALNLGRLEKVLFGSHSESLEKPCNSLLLSTKLKRWFDLFFLVIVPVDSNEVPIKRWKLDIIYEGIRRNAYKKQSKIPVDDFDGKELTFLNDKRPAARFLYFHFVVALLQAKRLNRPNWKSVWARYREARLFPSPGPYIRNSMLQRLVADYGMIDVALVESWMKDNGFDGNIRLTHFELDEATELSRLACASKHPEEEQDQSHNK